MRVGTYVRRHALATLQNRREGSAYIVILNRVFSAARPCRRTAQQSVSSRPSLTGLRLQGANCELNTLGSDDFPDGVRKQPTLQL